MKLLLVAFGAMVWGSIWSPTPSKVQDGEGPIFCPDCRCMVTVTAKETAVGAIAWVYFEGLNTPPVTLTMAQGTHFENHELAFKEGEVAEVMLSEVFSWNSPHSFFVRWPDEDIPELFCALF